MEKNRIYQGNSLKVLSTFPTESIDLCVTSPPYWGLRDYGTEYEIWDGDENCEHEWFEYVKPARGGKSTKENPSIVGGNKHMSETSVRGEKQVSNFCSKCGAWKGELGLEPTPELYIKHLTDIFHEVKRVLKSTGTLWINIGDTYAGGGQRDGQPEDYDSLSAKNKEKYPTKSITKGIVGSEYKSKDLIGIPWKLAFSLRSDGWFLRQDIIWAKATSGDIRMGSVMPESVTDRCSKSHEYIFLFSKEKNYYFDYTSIQEPLKESTKVRYQKGWNGDEKRDYIDGDQNHFSKLSGSERAKQMEKGNRRSVWFVKLKPFKEAHFAVFPENLISPIIRAGCPTKVCPTCKKPYDIILKKESLSNDRGKSSSDHRAIGIPQRSNCYSIVESVEKAPSCSCEANTKFEAGIVLDPFFGSGTTGVIAKKLNIFYIGVEKNKKYIDIAEKRIKDTSSML